MPHEGFFLVTIASDKFLHIIINITLRSDIIQTMPSKST